MNGLRDGVSNTLEKQIDKENSGNSGDGEDYATA